MMTGVGQGGKQYPVTPSLARSVSMQVGEVLGGREDL